MPSCSSFDPRLKQVAALLGIGSRSYEFEHDIYHGVVAEDNDVRARALIRIVGGSKHRKFFTSRAQSLRGTSAQRFLDACFALVESGHLQTVDTDNRLQHRTLKLLRNLARDSGLIPAGLRVMGGITDIEPFPGIASNTVQRARYGGITVVLKKMNTNLPGPSGANGKKELLQESLIWRTLHHPHIVPLLGVTESPPGTLHVVSEYLPLRSIMDFRGTLIGAESLDVLARLTEIADALVYLHREQIVHGDLCGDNVLMVNEHSAALCDFGLSSMDAATRTTNVEDQIGGRIAYQAPETLSYPPERKSFASDVFAFGSLCYEIYQGVPPLHGLNTQQQLNIMREGILNYTQMIRPQATTRVIDMPVFMWDTVRRCWRAKSTRPTMERVSRALEMQRPH